MAPPPLNAHPSPLNLIAVEGSVIPIASSRTRPLLGNDRLRTENIAALSSYGDMSAT